MISRPPLILSAHTDLLKLILDEDFMHLVYAINQQKIEQQALRPASNRRPPNQSDYSSTASLGSVLAEGEARTRAPCASSSAQAGPQREDVNR